MAGIHAARAGVDAAGEGRGRELGECDEREMGARGEPVAVGVRGVVAGGGLGLRSESRAAGATGGRR